MVARNQIDTFLASPTFGVVGASKDRNKFGNKVLRCYLQNGRQAIPVNPHQQFVEGLSCVASVAELPDQVVSISIITPPSITEKAVVQAAEKGIKNIWMQPGAQSEVAIRFCEQRGINLIADGTCVLVELGFSGH